MPVPNTPSFKVALENQIELIMRDDVGYEGIYSDPVNYVQEWTRRLGDFDVNNDLPQVVISARQTTQLPRGQGEMGTSQELWNWMVDIYYLDIEQTDWDLGYARMDNIVNRMRNSLENEPRLRNLRVATNPLSPIGYIYENVYNNDWLSMEWDTSGQEGYEAFVVTMHLLVQTDRSQN
jgi:hypothetical protein